MNKVKARVIAFYLPQFHPIPENDKWWGKGFTEWTNVRKAIPLFKGHYQPKVPTDLGYYDLRMPEVREAQAEMARNSGIEGFMYWHYWFGNGKTLLERPFKEVVESGKPEFPFCVGWANHSWENKTWNSSEQNRKSKTLIEQVYPGEEDYRNHFYYLLNAFKDERYLTIDGKPIFLIFSPLDFYDVNLFISLWQSLAKNNGFKGIYFLGQAHINSECNKILSLGFDGVNRNGSIDAAHKIKGKYIFKIFSRLREMTKLVPLNKFKYSDIIENILIPEIDKIQNIYPTVFSNFDHSPRSGRKGLIYVGSTPDLFQKLLQKAIQIVHHKQVEHRIIFLKSWNEWAEGNYVEPDLLYGHGYLNALKEEIFIDE